MEHPMGRRIEHMTWLRRIQAARDWFWVITMVATPIALLFSGFWFLILKAYSEEIEALKRLPVAVVELQNDMKEVKRRLPQLQVIDWNVGPGDDQSNGICREGEDFCEINLVFSRTPDGAHCDIIGGEAIYRIYAVVNGVERRWDVNRRDNNALSNATEQVSQRTHIIDRPRNLPAGGAEYSVRTSYEMCGDLFDEEEIVIRWSDRIPLTVE